LYTQQEIGGDPVRNESKTHVETWIVMAALTVFSFAALWAVVNLFYALR
jgi:hypothetical protein